ncbi:hypothetical protein BDZ89DRAFT_1238658 [Hymenopellis radicata]|nr:hypothetical protein BDZ89DRAFT_1238658 [Hymenopellis radicata]
MPASSHRPLDHLGLRLRDGSSRSSFYVHGRSYRMHNLSIVTCILSSARMRDHVNSEHDDLDILCDGCLGKLLSPLSESGVIDATNTLNAPRVLLLRRLPFDSFQSSLAWEALGDCCPGGRRRRHVEQRPVWCIYDSHPSEMPKPPEPEGCLDPRVELAASDNESSPAPEERTSGRFRKNVASEAVKKASAKHAAPRKGEKCGQTFTAKHNLIRTPMPDSKPFKCKYCPGSFGTSGVLARHVKKQHDDMDSDDATTSYATRKPEIASFYITLDMSSRDGMRITRKKMEWMNGNSSSVRNALHESEYRASISSEPHSTHPNPGSFAVQSGDIYHSGSFRGAIGNDLARWLFRRLRRLTLWRVVLRQNKRRLSLPGGDHLTVSVLCGNILAIVLSLVILLQNSFNILYITVWGRKLWPKTACTNSFSLEFSFDSDKVFGTAVEETTSDSLGDIDEDAS